MRLFIGIFLLSFLLGACGLKGPLYSPGKDAAAKMFTSPSLYRIV